jgi:hypothetical protein
MEAIEQLINSTDATLMEEPTHVLRHRVQTWIDPLLISYKTAENKDEIIAEYNSICDGCYLMLCIRRKQKFEDARRACVFGLPTENLWKSLYDEDAFIYEFCKIHGYTFPC